MHVEATCTENVTCVIRTFQMFTTVNLPRSIVLRINPMQ